MKIASLFSSLLLTVLLVSCSPQSDDDTVYNSCRITRVYAQGDTSQTSTYWLYNNQQLSVLNMPGPLDLYFSYNGNTITVGDGSSSYTRFYLRPDSLAYASARYHQGSFIDTVLYEYDTTGHLVKEVCHSTLFGKDSIFMTYSNGNMTAYRWYLANGYLIYGDFTYTDIPSRHWFYNSMGPSPDNRGYYPWLGKPNTHLIKSVTSNFNGSVVTDNFTYTLNASGYVTGYKGSGTTGTYQNFIEYQCQ